MRGDRSLEEKHRGQKGTRSASSTARVKTPVELESCAPDSIAVSRMERPRAQPEHDVLVIGCGLSGIYTLCRLQQLGVQVKAFDTASGEGGTWFWNRYPGCRFDSESVSYGFSFSQEVLDEWDWTETYAPAHEVLKYVQYWTEKFDLRKHMQFNTKIVSAHYQQDGRMWRLTDSSGRTYTSRFLITAMGLLNEPTLPDLPGIGDFQGQAFHSSRWPEDGDARLKGQRVGIVGTGATGIQIIQTIVKPEFAVKSLTVFQRTPNWSAPLRNESITPEGMRQIRKEYPAIFDKCSKSWSGFIHMADTRKTLEVPEDERLDFWEDLYSKPGFAKWIANFADINFDRDANAAFSAFVADKIRQCVADPTTAEKLIPKNHGFGTRRVPLETNYFAAYNDERVRLVDVADEARIERITATGIQLHTGEHIELDTLIFATGFDAITGSFTSIDIRGVDHTSIRDVWSEGPQTYLGLFVHRFPNMMMIMGPHQMFGNIPRSIEFAVDWVATFIQFCLDHDITRAEAREEMAGQWTEHVHSCAQGSLSSEVDSWITGVNGNVPGKQKRIIARYAGSGPGYRQRCQDVAERRYDELDLE